MENNGIDPNAGVSGEGNPGSSDQGGQGAIPSSQPNGTPNGQPDGQPTTWATEKEQMSRDIKALNRALIESRRGRGQNPQGNPDEDMFTTPEGQYAISLQLATGNLKSGLEPIFDLYPEIPAEDIARIRKNPWAFASQDSYMKGDHETALLEIEQALLERANTVSAPKQPGNTVPATTPATVNNNPTPEVPGQEATPGTDEDENLWTMPMDKLVAVKNKEVAKVSHQA
jgi:hypothetical protein